MAEISSDPPCTDRTIALWITTANTRPTRLESAARQAPIHLLGQRARGLYRPSLPRADPICEVGILISLRVMASDYHRFARNEIKTRRRVFISFRAVFPVCFDAQKKTKGSRSLITDPAVIVRQESHCPVSETRPDQSRRMSRCFEQQQRCSWNAFLPPRSDGQNCFRCAV